MRIRQGGSQWVRKTALRGTPGRLRPVHDGRVGGASVGQNAPQTPSRAPRRSCLGGTCEPACEVEGPTANGRGARCVARNGQRPLPVVGWVDSPSPASAPRGRQTLPVVPQGGTGRGRTANGQRPTANGQRPTANGQRPTANGTERQTHPLPKRAARGIPWHRALTCAPQSPDAPPSRAPGRPEAKLCCVDGRLSDLWPIRHCRADVVLHR